jgi:hypothetical protein
MNRFSEKLKENLSQEVFLKDVNNGSYGGILKEVGEDYCVLAIAKRAVIYQLAHIVSVEPRMQAPVDPKPVGSP